MIPKPGKAPEEVTSYRPISLLPVISKVFEKLLLKRLGPIIAKNKLIPGHQFGFRPQHATIEQVHRVVNIIRQDLEDKRYCSAAFLDISQAFDKVWHPGLLYKIKQGLPYTYFKILQSYLTERFFRVKCGDTYTGLCPTTSGVPQGSVLGPILYLLYTADLPTSRNTNIATFADDTVVLASHQYPDHASMALQENLTQIQKWLNKWRIRANESKSVHVTFTMRQETCPPVKLNNQTLPQAENAKYLGMHLDRRLTWKNHIWMKRKQLNLKVTKMYWLLGRRSNLSTENKLLIYKTILKPVWTYGIQLWGTASNSNIEILQRFQSKTLRMIVNAPQFVPNEVIHHDLQMATVKEEIANYSSNYQVRLVTHPNSLAVDLLNDSKATRRLKRSRPLDLNKRFNSSSIQK